MQPISAIEQLRATVARLRAPGGCPWDREQTHQSLARCLVEECAELLETIDEGDIQHMREELGDVLLQVVMHAQIAEEEGHFDLAAVAKEVDEKLVRRHPHVFGDGSGNTINLKDTQAVLEHWEKIKAREKKDDLKSKGLFKDLPPQLPALLFGLSVFKQMLKQNLPRPKDWQEASVVEQSEELTEMAAGKALFELTAACYLAKIDPESALRRYTQQAMKESETAAKERASSG